MFINDKTRKYGLIGNPIAKTLSPFIHNKLYRELEVNNIYLAYEGKDSLKSIVDSLRVLNIEGYNVTIPYKKGIMKYLDEIDSEAKKIGAVNTVKYSEGKLLGYNTDGLGFLRTIKDYNIKLKDKVILVIGSGGASYSICTKLIEEGIQKIYILNRSKENALKLIEHLSNYINRDRLELCNLDRLDKSKVDIIINTSSVGMYPNINETPIELEGFDDVIVYDIIYKPLKTKFIREGELLGFKTINGLEMLINQAIYSQEIWLDKEIGEDIRKKIVSKLKYHIGDC